jgi:hypothetical protein
MFRLRATRVKNGAADGEATGIEQIIRKWAVGPDPN